MFTFNDLSILSNVSYKRSKSRIKVNKLWKIWLAAVDDKSGKAHVVLEAM
jgi:hypothetical protein